MSWNGNGNGHHHGENGNGNGNGNGNSDDNDPARFAAVSALAAFSQGGAQAYPAQPYAYQNQQQHPMHPQQQQQYSREELEYNQYQRMQQGQQQQQQQQQQQWGNDQPPNGTTQQHAHSQPASEPDSEEEDDNNVAVAADPVDEGTDDDDDDEPEEAVATMEHEDDAMEADDNSDAGSVQKPAPIVPRGKPEAMAVKLAAAAMNDTREDLEDAETGGQESDAEVVAEVEGEAGEAEEALMDESDAVVVAKVEKPKPNRGRSLTKKPRKKAPAAPTSERTELLLTENTPGITDEEYENLEALMIQFCRVPLLAEFSRPVTLLHPEVSVDFDLCVHTRVS
jgi:hypothetical protein